MNKLSLRSQLVAAALVTCFSAVAVAQGMPSHAGGPGARPDPVKMQERHARKLERLNQRLAELKQKLQISAGQEAAWTTWTNAMRPPAPSQRAAVDFSTLTTPQRIDRMRTMRAERMGFMDKRADATLAFYTTLNAQQKQVFDQETARLFQRRGMGGGHGMGGHGGHGGPGGRHGG